MPIFQDDLGGGQDSPPAHPKISPLSQHLPEENVLERKLSEESIRTELCEGLVLDSAETGSLGKSSLLGTSCENTEHSTSDRIEYIQRLKRGESPTWLPNRNFELLIRDRSSSKPASNTPNSTRLIPSPDILEANRSKQEDLTRSQAGLQIERPRSALHSGDFTEALIDNNVNSGTSGSGSYLYASERSTWLATSPPRDFSPFHADTRFPPSHDFTKQRSRAPSLSSSLSSSFVFKPPTSPLVQSQSNEDFEISPNVNPIDIMPDYHRNARRHTLQSSLSSHSTPSVNASSPSKTLPGLRRDNTYPYQAHQPRRSLTSSHMAESISSPQTPELLRSRRPSFSEHSPLHASMVGSYEESILRGRMSTTPSKPLDFVAQIGVLGLGKCKSSLRCPGHVTIPFPAVFYSYETTTHGRVGKSEDGPSPYVGQIDLESNLTNQNDGRDSKRKRYITNTGRAPLDDLDMLDTESVANQIDERDLRRVQKQKRRSTSPRAPPGGSYRIPEKGQVQIVIKNPNKTAVKLFLVPYDLAGMEPGTKTFIRQRSYSAGPIIDSAVAPVSRTTSPEERPILRYLVHLHICSPARGRFYLYKSIRVVFANRVPDGKEKLRNEISLPEPRFSIYKPNRDSNLGFGMGNSGGASLKAEKAYRRRSSGFALGPSNRVFDTMDGITRGLEKDFTGGSGLSYGIQNAGNLPIQPIPFSFAREPSRLSDDFSQGRPPDIQSPTSSKSSRPPTSQGSVVSLSWNNDNAKFGGYDKLSKGELGYGGNLFATSPDGKQGIAEGLLAKKLRDLSTGLNEKGARSDGT